MTTLIRVLLFVTILTSAIIVSATDDCHNNKVECKTSDYGISVEEIAQHPDPKVELIPFNEDLIYDRWYKQVNGTTDVYDAPNGNVIRTIDAGFNFVTALQESDGWTKINVDEWIKTENLSN